MRRAALLIGAPGTDLPGVNTDIENMSAFLKRSIGGAWRSSEIKVLKNPSRAEVDSSVAALKTVDYSFVFFAGHGRYSVQRNTTELQLQPNIHLEINALKIGALKHTVVADTCRVLHGAVLKKAMEAVALDSSNFSESNARQIFDAHLALCPIGLVELYSCNLNETAGESASDGGRYTSSLIAAAGDWKRQVTRTAQHVYSIKNAHDDAAKKVVLLSGGRQNPQSNYPRSSPYFPFAVSG